MQVTYIYEVNPFDVTHLKKIIVKVPRRPDWEQIEIGNFHSEEIIYEGEAEFRLKVCVLTILGENSMVQQFCEPCRTSSQAETCIACGRATIRIYDFGLVVKQDPLHSAVFTIHFTSKNGDNLNFFKGTSPKEFDDNYPNFFKCVELEKRLLYSYNHFIWVIVKVVKRGDLIWFEGINDYTHLK